MAITWQAKGLRGHISTITLAPRGSTTIDLRVASYNDVKIYPRNLYVQNASNNGGVNVASQNGFVRGIAPLVNYRLDISPDDIITITNYGSRPVSLLVADAAAEAETDISILVGTSAPAITPSDLLLHFDKSDLTNDGITSFSITPVNITYTTTANIKFGSAAAVCGGGNEIKFFNAGFFDFSQDFSMDGWYKWAGLNTTMVLMSAVPAASFVLYIVQSLSQLILRINGVDVANVPYTFVLGDYNHVAVSKQNQAWKVFINGQLKISVVSAYAPVLDALTFSSNTFAGAWNGWFDEAHYVKGLAMYTDNFTPPSEPYY